jgi:hypothetical protein
LVGKRNGFDVVASILVNSTEGSEHVAPKLLLRWNRTRWQRIARGCGVVAIAYVAAPVALGQATPVARLLPAQPTEEIRPSQQRAATPDYPALGGYRFNTPSSIPAPNAVRPNPVPNSAPTRPVVAPLPVSVEQQKSLLGSGFSNLKELFTAKPAEGKPAEVKPAEAKPAEAPIASPVIFPQPNNMQPAQPATPPPSQYAGVPAYRWYGYGSPTPGGNPYAPTGLSPKGSANWYQNTGATPGAFPVPAATLQRAHSSEPPTYNGPIQPTDAQYLAGTRIPAVSRDTESRTATRTDTTRPADNLPSPPNSRLLAQTGGANPTTAPTADTGKPGNRSVGLPELQMPNGNGNLVTASADITPNDVAWQTSAARHSQPIASSADTNTDLTAPSPDARFATPANPAVPTSTTWQPSLRSHPGSETPNVSLSRAQASVAPNAPSVSMSRAQTSTAPAPISSPAEPNVSISRGQPATETVEDLEATIRSVCHGRASRVVVKSLGTKRLHIRLVAPTDSDARDAAAVVSQLPQLKAFAITFEATIER